jgi:hypothetical protein
VCDPVHIQRLKFFAVPELDFGHFFEFIGRVEAEHRIVLDDVVGALEHEFQAAEAAKGAPATMDVGPIEQLEAIRVGESRSLAMGSESPRLNTK